MRRRRHAAAAGRKAGRKGLQREGRLGLLGLQQGERTRRGAYRAPLCISHKVSSCQHVCLSAQLPPQSSGKYLINRYWEAGKNRGRGEGTGLAHLLPRRTAKLLRTRRRTPARGAQCEARGRRASKRDRPLMHASQPRNQQCQWRHHLGDQRAAATGMGTGQGAHRFRELIEVVLGAWLDLVRRSEVGLLIQSAGRAPPRTRAGAGTGSTPLLRTRRHCVF